MQYKILTRMMYHMDTIIGHILDCDKFITDVSNISTEGELEVFYRMNRSIDLLGVMAHLPDVMKKLQRNHSLMRIFGKYTVLIDENKHPTVLENLLALCSNLILLRGGTSESLHRKTCSAYYGQENYKVLLRCQEISATYSPSWMSTT
eukprot:UN02566